MNELFNAAIECSDLNYVCNIFLNEISDRRIKVIEVRNLFIYYKEKV